MSDGAVPFCLYSCIKRHKYTGGKLDRYAPIFRPILTYSLRQPATASLAAASGRTIRVDFKEEKFENYDNEKLKKALKLADVEQVALTDKLHVTITFKGEQDAYCLQMQCDEVRLVLSPQTKFFAAGDSRAGGSTILAVACAHPGPARWGLL